MLTSIEMMSEDLRLNDTTRCNHRPKFYHVHNFLNENLALQSKRIFFALLPTTFQGTSQAINIRERYFYEAFYLLYHHTLVKKSSEKIADLFEKFDGLRREFASFTTFSYLCLCTIFCPSLHLNECVASIVKGK